MLGNVSQAFTTTTTLGVIYVCLIMDQPLRGLINTFHFSSKAFY